MIFPSCQSNSEPSKKQKKSFLKTICFSKIKNTQFNEQDKQKNLIEYKICDSDEVFSSYTRGDTVFLRKDYEHFNCRLEMPILKINKKTKLYYVHRFCGDMPLINNYSSQIINDENKTETIVYRIEIHLIEKHSSDRKKGLQSIRYLTLSKDFEILEIEQIDYSEKGFSWW